MKSFKQNTANIYFRSNTVIKGSTYRNDFIPAINSFCYLIILKLILITQNKGYRKMTPSMYGLTP